MHFHTMEEVLDLFSLLPADSAIEHSNVPIIHKVFMPDSSWLFQMAPLLLLMGFYQRPMSISWFRFAASQLTLF
jgi:hypothetical protein